MEKIREDKDVEKSIGTAQSLDDYTNKNPAIDTLKDGLLGKLRAYFRTAAENEEID